MAQAALAEGGSGGVNVLPARRKFHNSGPRSGQPQAPFARHEQTGPPSGKTLDRQGREMTIPERTDGIPEDLRSEFAESAIGDFARLVELHNDPRKRDKYLRMIADDAYQPYKVIMSDKRFVRIKPGSTRAGVPILELNEDALRKHFMTDNEGFTDAYRFRVIKLEEMALNLCEKISKNLPPPGPQMIEDQDIRTGRGGPGREAARSLRLLLGKRHTTYGRDTPAMGAFDTYGETAAAIATMSTILGAIGSTVGPVGTFVGAAIPPAIAGLAHAFRRGERITLHEARMAFDTVKTISPERREWAREMYNIDASNREVRGGHVVIRGRIDRNRHLARPEVSAKTARHMLVEDATKIESAQKWMGVPRELRMAMDNWDPSAMPAAHETQFIQRNIPWEVEAQKEFMQYHLVDSNGNRCLLPDPPPPPPPVPASYRVREWIPNAAFRLDRVDPIVMRDRYLIVRRKHFAADLRIRFQQADELAADREKQLQELLARRRGDYGPDGAVTKQRTAAAERSIKTLNGDKERLDRELTPVDAVSTEFDSVEEARRKEVSARSKVTPAFGLPANTDALQVLDTVLNDMTPDPALPVGPTPGRGIVVTLRDENGHPQTVMSISGRDAAERARHKQELQDIQDSAEKAATDAAARVAAAGGSIRDQNAAAATASAAATATMSERIRNENETFQNNLNDIERDRERVGKAREAILQSQQAVDAAQKTAAAKVGEHRDAVQEFGRGLDEARRTIIGMLPPYVHPVGFPAPGDPYPVPANSNEEVVNYIHREIVAGTLPVDFLDFADTLQTADFGVLMQRMNQIRDIAELHRGAGWVWPAGQELPGFPEEEATREDRRTLLQHAMIEARAGRIQPLVTTPSSEFTTATEARIYSIPPAPPGTRSDWGLREVDILVSSRSELKAMLADRARIIIANAGIPPLGFAGGPPPLVPIMPTDADLDKLQGEALLRFRARQETAQAMRGAIDGVIKTEEQNRDRIVEDAADNSELEMMFRAESLMRETMDRITSMTEEQIARALDPAQLAQNAGEEYERFIPGTPPIPIPGGYVWLLDQIAGHRTDDVDFQNEHGHQGAFLRNMTYLPPALLVNLLRDFAPFGLNIPPAALPPTTPPNVAFAQLTAQLNMIRQRLVPPTPPGYPPRQPIINSLDVARFVGDRVVMDYMGERAHTV